VGFSPFLSIGILSGAVWANETWMGIVLELGSKRKEPWAFITWTIFRHLFTYAINQSEGVNSAIVASMGFPFGYAMLLGSGIGLDSYGSFTLTSNLIE